MIDWRDSSTYRMILEEGRQEGFNQGVAEAFTEGVIEGRMKAARYILLRLGTKRFGVPDTRSQIILDATTRLDELERLEDGILEAESWAELLAVQ